MLGRRRAAETVTLKFWDNQQTESGLSAVPAGGGEALRGGEPRHQGRGHDDPLSGVPAAAADRGAGRQRAGCLDRRPDLDRGLRRGRRHRAARRPGEGRPASRPTPSSRAPGSRPTTRARSGASRSTSTSGSSPSTTTRCSRRPASIRRSIVTWEGLKAAAPKLTDAARGNYGVGLYRQQERGHRSVMTNSFIYSNGGTVLDADGKCALTSPAAVEALEFYKTMTAYAPAGHPQRRERATCASCSSTARWPWSSGRRWSSRRCRSPSSTGTSSPAIAPEGKTPVGTFGGWNLVVYQQSPHKDAAWKFIQFMTREDVNGAVVDLIPANVEAAKTFLEANRKHPDRDPRRTSNNAKPRPLSPRYLEVSDIEISWRRTFMSGTAPADAAKKACEASTRSTASARPRRGAARGARPGVLRPRAGRLRAPRPAARLAGFVAAGDRCWSAVLMYYPMIGTVSREPVHDLLHQPDPEVRRARDLPARSSPIRASGRWC